MTGHYSFIYYFPSTISPCTISYHKSWCGVKFIIDGGNTHRRPNIYKLKVYLIYITQFIFHILNNFMEMLYLLCCFISFETICLSFVQIILLLILIHRQAASQYHKYSKHVQVEEIIPLVNNNVNRFSPAKGVQYTSCILRNGMFI